MITKKTLSNESKRFGMNTIGYKITILIWHSIELIN